MLHKLLIFIARFIEIETKLCLCRIFRHARVGINSHSSFIGRNFGLVFCEYCDLGGRGKE